MIRIDVPISGWERLGGPGLIAVLALLAATSPVPPIWRVVEVLAVVTLGAWQYRAYRVRRPFAVLITPAGAPVLCLPGGALFAVATVRIGSATPALLAARCATVQGDTLDLFIPGSVVSLDEHRWLRRAMLALRASTPGRSTEPQRSETR